MQHNSWLPALILLKFHNTLNNFYTQKDAGLLGALMMMIFLGLVGATIAGLIIDYTKKFKEVAVISLTPSSVS